VVDQFSITRLDWHSRQTGQIRAAARRIAPSISGAGSCY